MTEMEENERVELLRGDPKKAINKLALPMIASMLLMSANNIIDSIWVSGIHHPSVFNSRRNRNRAWSRCKLTYRTYDWRKKGL